MNLIIILPRYQLLIGLITLSVLTLSAQDQKAYTLYGGLQVWTRYTDLNPGSSIGVDQYDQSFDISVRRYRFGVKGHPYENISYNLQFGNNNLSRYNKDQPPKVLDAYVSYRFGDFLTITGGKHGWTGLSRYAAPSTFSALGADIHFLGNPVLNAHDDFFRKLGIALHGGLNRFDYRFVFSKPFIYRSQPEISQKSVLTDNPTSLNVSSYLKYQFFDLEATTSAWSPWTYLGKKKILNFGIGVTHQSAVSESLTMNGDTVNHPWLSFSADVFYEIPVNKQVWTAYVVYYKHELGPDFIRYIGANNPASSGGLPLILNGEGNRFPEVGTGQMVMAQVGYLRKLENHAIQPNATLEVGDFEALNEPMILWEAGINYLLDDHTSKLSFTYQNRPIFLEDQSGIIVSDRKSMVVLQYQIRF